jgi:sugar phosphate permease
MLPMRFFADRAFAAGNASAFLLFASLYGMVFYIAQYLQVSLAYSPFAAGLRFLPWTALIFVVAPASGRLADRSAGRLLVALGLVLQGVGAGWIAVNAADGRSYGSSMIALVISGAGLATAMPAVQQLVLNAVPPSALGKASGTFNTVRQLGGVVGVGVLAAVFSANGSYASPRAFGSGAGAALAVAAALAGAGAVIALFAPGRDRPRGSGPTRREPAAVGEPARVG